MKWPPPLRVSIPLVLLLFASATGVIMLRYSAELEYRNLEDRMRERAQFVGTQLAGMCSYFSENLAPSASQRVIALAATDRDLHIALLLNADDQVLHSTRYELIGRPLAGTPAAPSATLIARARTAHAGEVAFSEDARSMLGFFPFPITPRTGGAVRNTEFGVVYLEFDLTERRASIEANLARRAWLGGSVLLGLCAGFSLLFGPLLSARVRRLARTARQLAAGDPEARSGLHGSDELAELARAFDQMAADIQHGHADVRESEARFRFLVEGIPQIFWLDELDPYRPLYVGPGFERVWGHSREAFYARPSLWNEAIHAEDRARTAAAYADWTEGRAPAYDVTFRVLGADGCERWVRNRGTSFDAGPDGRRRVAGLAEDITAQRKHEAEADELERKLQETQKLESLGVLAGGIAHDFNNLLTGILGNASLARQDISPSSPAQPHLEQIEAVTLRAGELCKQMLAYSGKGRFQVQRLDLSELVRETTQLIQLSIDKTAVLRFELAGSLPPIEADATQIRQVVMNLVINASEALGGKSGVIAINTGIIRADREYLDRTVLSPDLPEGDYAFMEVSDTGCGMTTEQQARMFEPFFTTKFTGRGLGLSAVLGIVRGHRGAMRVYSEAGRGTTFKVVFPAASGEAEPPPTERAATPWSGTGAVLVVDDEPTVRTVAARIIEKFGFTAIVAADGREGVEKFLAHRSEIVAVLMDLTMPHLDGESAFRELRAIDPDVRVVLMSGFNEQDAINRFTGKGLAGFVQKPFKPETLRRKLKEALEGPVL
ncbi:MAG: response regulator [Chthoniobacteraceae bacterium]